MLGPRRPGRRRVLVPLVIAVALLCAPAGAQATRALTWNIAGGPNNARTTAGIPFDKAAIEAVIRRADPDVAGLQEVCGWQAAALGADLGYSVWHVPAITGFTDPRPGANGTCDYGIALLAKPPLALDARSTAGLLGTTPCKADAQTTGRPECRVVQSAVLDGGAVPVHVANTHIGVDATARAQRTRLATGAAALPAPAVLLGDDNVGPDAPELGPRLAAAGFLDAAGALPGLPCIDAVGCALSFPSGGAFGMPSSRADYVWYRGARARTATSGRADTAVDGVPASDHLALVGDLAPDAARPSGGVSIKPRALRNLRQYGLRVSVGTVAPAAVSVTLSASTATARRWRLADPVIASAAAPAPGTLTLKPGPALARTLRRATSARLVVAVTLTDAGGARTRLPTRTIILRQTTTTAR